MSDSLLTGLPYSRARQLARGLGATIGRACWHHSRCVVYPPEGLTLVVRDGGLPWEPHSIDLRATDWLALLPTSDA